MCFVYIPSRLRYIHGYMRNKILLFSGTLIAEVFIEVVLAINYKSLKFRKGVGIAIKSKETSSKLAI